MPLELEKQELEEVRFMIDVNLMGTFHLIKAFLSRMKHQKEHESASIDIISSQANQVGIYGYTAYTTSKFSLMGLTKALQQEAIVDNIYVSLIFPLETETPGIEARHVNKGILKGCRNMEERNHNEKGGC